MFHIRMAKRDGGKNMKYERSDEERKKSKNFLKNKKKIERKNVWQYHAVPKKKEGGKTHLS